MYGLSEWNADQLLGTWIREGNRPWQVSRHAPAAARRKTPQAPNGMPHGQPRRERVHSLEDRQMLAPHKENGHGQRGHEATVKDAGRLQRGKRKDFAPVV